jgi:hypothetical protein
MHKLLSLALALVVTGCGITMSSQTDAQSQAASQAGNLFASPAATGSPRSVAEPDGVFVFVPAVIDCPGGCPTSSVSQALAEPGTPGTPLLVDGAVFIEPDGSAWLCERLTGDSPPSCDGASLRFENADLYAPSLEANGVQELDGFRWLDGVTIPGEVMPGG